MARPISMLVEPSIGCKITSYVKDGDPVVTPVFIGDKVTDQCLISPWFTTYIHN
jgi:hypothetical protein